MWYGAVMERGVPRENLDKREKDLFTLYSARVAAIIAKARR